MGFTLGEIDSVLAPYAEKSFKNYYNEYINIVKESSILDTEIDVKKAQKWALSKVEKDIEYLEIELEDVNVEEVLQDEDYKALTEENEFQAIRRKLSMNEKTRMDIGSVNSYMPL